MANIESYINQLSNPSTDGHRARSIIVAACEDINTNGTNAKTLQGHGADYFFSVSELNDLFEPYFRKIGLVHNLDKVTDENNKPTVLTELYKRQVGTSASSNSKDVKETQEVQIGVQGNDVIYRKNFTNTGKNTIIKSVVIEDIKSVVAASASITNVGEINVKAYTAGEEVYIDYPQVYQNGQPIKNVMRVTIDYTKTVNGQVDANKYFDITLPTSNSVWLKLGYSELSDLQEYINS